MMASKRRKSKRNPLGQARNMPARAKRDERIAAAYAKGKSRDQLAEQHDLSPHTVGRILWEQGGRALRA